MIFLFLFFSFLNAGLKGHRHWAYIYSHRLLELPKPGFLLYQCMSSADDERNGSPRKRIQDFAWSCCVAVLKQETELGDEPKHETI